MNFIYSKDTISGEAFLAYQELLILLDAIYPQTEKEWKEIQKKIMKINAFGNFIKEKRKMLNLTQAKVAKDLGFKRPLMCMYESGSRFPKEKNFALLKKYFSITPEEETEIGFRLHETLVKKSQNLNCVQLMQVLNAVKNRLQS